MKTVFKNHSELAHEFATNGNDLNRRGKSSSIFFERGVIYSYGYHFAIAKYLNDNTLLFTTSSYSNSTAKHINHTRQALRHKNLIFCPDPLNISRCFGYWIVEAQTNANKLSKAKKPEIYLTELHRLSNQVARYCEVMNETAPAELVELLAIKDKEQYKNWVDVANKRKEAEEKRQAEQRKQKTKQQIYKFLAGQVYRLDYRTKFDLLRDNGESIRTSQGLDIPKTAAVKLWEAIKSNLIKEGDKFLQYQVNQVGKFISIGCHTFNRAYLINFGKKLK